MFSTQKKKQQTMELHSQLRESDTDLMIGKNNHESQAENGAARVPEKKPPPTQTTHLNIVTFKWMYIHLRRIILTKCVAKRIL